VQQIGPKERAATTQRQRVNAVVQVEQIDGVVAKKKPRQSRVLWLEEARNRDFTA
jgi:hypothetical protein